MTEALEPEQWLEMAANDLAAARKLTAGEFPSKVCFFAQQCAERAIKATIIYLDAEMPYTHELKDLWAIVRGAEVTEAPEVEAALTLTHYAVEARYDANLRISSQEAEQALALAAPVLTWAEAPVRGRKR